MKMVIEGVKGVIVILGCIAAINVAAMIVRSYSSDEMVQSVPMVDPNVPSHHADDLPPLGKDGL